MPPARGSKSSKVGPSGLRFEDALALAEYLSGAGLPVERYGGRLEALWLELRAEEAELLEEQGEPVRVLRLCRTVVLHGARVLVQTDVQGRGAARSHSATLGDLVTRMRTGEDPLASMRRALRSKVAVPGEWLDRVSVLRREEEVKTAPSPTYPGLMNRSNTATLWIELPEFLVLGNGKNEFSVAADDCVYCWKWVPRRWSQAKIRASFAPGTEQLSLQRAEAAEQLAPSSRRKSALQREWTGWRARSGGLEGDPERHARGPSRLFPAPASTAIPAVAAMLRRPSRPAHRGSVPSRSASPSERRASAVERF